MHCVCIKLGTDSSSHLPFRHTHTKAQMHTDHATYSLATAGVSTNILLTIQHKIRQQ